MAQWLPACRGLRAEIKPLLHAVLSAPFPGKLQNGRIYSHLRRESMAELQNLIDLVNRFTPSRRCARRPVQRNAAGQRIENEDKPGRERTGYWPAAAGVPARSISSITASANCEVPDWPPTSFVSFSG